MGLLLSDRRGDEVTPLKKKRRRPTFCIECLDITSLIVYMVVCVSVRARALVRLVRLAPGFDLLPQLHSFKTWGTKPSLTMRF